MLTRAQKEEQVGELREKLARAKCVYVADYRGLDVQSVDELRSRIRREGDGQHEYRVTKNTLLRLAVADSDASLLREHFAGPTAVAISFDDPVGLAKILRDFAKDHAALELKGGLLEGEAIGAAEIETLATLPSLEELRGRIAGLLLAPAAKLARLLNEPGAALARLVEARRAQQAESEGGG